MIISFLNGFWLYKQRLSSIDIMTRFYIKSQVVFNKNDFKLGSYKQRLSSIDIMTRFYIKCQVVF